MFRTYVEQEVNNISIAKSKFNERKTHFDNTYAEIEALTKDDRELQSLLGVIGVSYSEYIEHTNTMFTAHAKEMLLQQQPLRIGALLGGVSGTANAINNDIASDATTVPVNSFSKAQLALSNS